MKEIIEKYETKLDFLNKAVEQTKHLLDEDTSDTMNNLKILLTEVITDFKAVNTFVFNKQNEYQFLLLDGHDNYAHFIPKKDLDKWENDGSCEKGDMLFEVKKLKEY